MKNEQETVTATFEKPIPLIGVHAQRLGFVERCRLTLEDRRIVQLELRTDWQTLQVRGDAVAYDEKQQVFRLVKRGRAVPPTIASRRMRQDESASS
jgi:hypothetical protein